MPQSPRRQFCCHPEQHRQYGPRDYPCAVFSPQGHSLPGPNLPLTLGTIPSGNPAPQNPEKVPAFHRLGAIALGTVSPRIRQSVSRSCRAIGYPPQGYSAPHYGRLHLPTQCRSLPTVTPLGRCHPIPSTQPDPNNTTTEKPLCGVPPCAVGVRFGAPRVCLGPSRGGPQRTTASASTNPRLRRSYSLWRGRFLGQLF